jgi:hypothetical protein
MKKSQAKKLYGSEGTSRTRKQWAIAKRRGKVPNNIERIPGYNPDRVHLTRQQVLLNKTIAKLAKVTVL